MVLQLSGGVEALTARHTDAVHGEEPVIVRLAKAAAHAYDDPATAVNWAATIENESLRGRMTQHLLGEAWRRLPDDWSCAGAWFCLRMVV